MSLNMSDSASASQTNHLQLFTTQPNFGKYSVGKIRGQNTLVSPSQVTWIGVSLSQKSLPKQLRHLVSFAGTWLLHLGVLRNVHSIHFWPKLEYAHPFGALTQNFRLIRLRKLR